MVEDIDMLFHEAAKSVDSGDYESAIKKYELILRKEKDNSMALWALGFFYFKTAVLNPDEHGGRLGSAKSLFESLLKIKRIKLDELRRQRWYCIDDLACLGWIFHEMEAYEPAKNCFKESLGLWRHNVPALSGMGIALLKTGKNGEGVSYLEEALNFGKKYVNGEIYEGAGREKRFLVARSFIIAFDTLRRESGSRGWMGFFSALGYSYQKGRYERILERDLV